MVILWFGADWNGHFLDCCTVKRSSSRLGADWNRPFEDCMGHVQDLMHIRRAIQNMNKDRTCPFGDKEQMGKIILRIRCRSKESFGDRVQMGGMILELGCRLEESY